LRFEDEGHARAYVMPALVAGIHVFKPQRFYDVAKAWIPVSSTGMTGEVQVHPPPKACCV
jgi:hypothetical protein